MTWAVMPAAGRGARFGGELPKQYRQLRGRMVIEHSLRCVLANPDVRGVVVALAADDQHWPGWASLEGKPVLSCVGGDERADSVLAGLRALPDSVPEEDWVLVHDAARPCLPAIDLARLLAALHADPVGVVLGVPLRDTVKQIDAAAAIAATVQRGTLWRALTPQAFRRGSLIRALESAERAAVTVTDEAMAFERLGLAPLLLEGSEQNIKITTATDLALAEVILRGRSEGIGARGFERFNG